MSFIFLAESGAVCSAERFSDIGPFVRWKLNLTADPFCSNVSATVACPGSPSGTTLPPSTAIPGAASSMLSAAASPARTSALPEREPASKASDPACGWKWPGSFAKFDPATHLLKTPQCLLDGDLEEFSGILPKWGSMRDGELFREKTPAGLEEIRRSITSGSESGFSQKSVPTPTKRSPTDCPAERRRSPALESVLKMQSEKVPTPEALNTEGYQVSGGKRYPRLGAVVKMPTPDASMGSVGSGGRVSKERPTGKRPSGAKQAITLNDAVKWSEKMPTPHGFSKDGKSNGPSGNELGRAVNESVRVGTPTAHPRTHDPRDVDHGIQLANQVGGSLNPTWVCWLMGWPLLWTCTEPLPPETWTAWQKAFGIASAD